MYMGVEFAWDANTGRRTPVLSLEEELEAIAAEADAIALRMTEPKFAQSLDALNDAAETAGRAWSGSWLGYQSRVYYAGLQPPPPGAHFDISDGLPDRYASDTVGDWVEYPYDQIHKILKDAAREPTFDELCELANRASSEMREARERLLSILNAVNQERNDTYLERLIKDADKIKTLTASEFARQHAPGQIMSSDFAALQHGIQTPPHIALLAQVSAIRSPFNAAGGIAKVARRAKNHLAHRKSSKVFRSGPGDKVFIGHGRSAAWRDLKDYVKDRLQLPYDEFNRVPVAGITNIARLSQMLDEAAVAFLVMTAEDELKDGKMHARMNVVHEAGLFQGRLGFTKAIVILEEGCEEFSNIEGLGQIRFPAGKIKAAFDDVRQVLEREGLIQD
jgi:predicted nucleotide-binding protein